MTELPTLQEKFFGFYNESGKKTDIAKFNEAISRCKEVLGLRPPYTDYMSFKNAYRYHKKGKKVRIN